jgi:hypothetical protein
MMELSIVIILELIFEDNTEKIVFLLDLLLAIFLLIYALILFNMRSKTEVKSQKDNYLGFGVFALSVALTQGAYFIDEFREKALLTELFPERIGIGGTGFEYIIIITVAFGIIFLMKPIEIYIQQKEKPRVHQFNIITFVLVMVPYLGACIYPMYDENPDYWTLMAFGALVFFIIAAVLSIFGSLLIYLKLGIKSTGVLREKGLYMAFGLIFLYAGLALTQYKTGLNIWFDALYGKVMMMIGALMTIHGQRLK